MRQAVHDLRQAFDGAGFAGFRVDKQTLSLARERCACDVDEVLAIAEIERRTGVDIAFIFEKEGEAGFRQREREAIEALTAMNRIVLATGGGAVLLPENRRHLAERGCVIYLETSVTQQVDRVKQGRNRPLLSNVDTSTKLAQLMDDRAPLYKEIADLVISTDGRRVRGVAEDILRQLGLAGETR